MDNLRIAVFLYENFDPKAGGRFSYYQRLVEKIDNYTFDKQIEICFVVKRIIGTENFKKQIIQFPCDEIEKVNWTFKIKLFIKILPFLKFFKIHKKIKNEIEASIALSRVDFLKKAKIDLIYYITPDFYPINYPFIATHWDLGHKSAFSFPEVSCNNKFINREYYHRITLQKAFAIFTESEQSRKELEIYESINKERIFVVPMFAGKVIEMDVDVDTQENILNKWNVLKKEFYFYPAQFWAHKNHFCLIYAFQIVLEKYPNFKLLLSGSDKGNLEYIKELVKFKKIEKNVIFTDIVTDEEIYTFYKNTIALVMPTYIGPTNMPLLEAQYLGCPVLCSDLDGHKEQMKNNAIYFDPKNYFELAMKMEEIIYQKFYNKQFLEELNIAKLLNKHFLALYNIRKTYGFNF